MSHTPGPWEFESDDFAIYATVGGTHIASITEAFDFPCLEESQREAVQLQCEANARLIAAGPTMYEYITRKAREGDVDAAEIIAAIG